MQNFNMLRNFFNSKPQAKSKYDFSYILNIDGRSEKIEKTDVFVAVLDKFSLDYVLYLKEDLRKIDNFSSNVLSSQNYHKSRRPMYELDLNKNKNKTKSRDLLNKDISEDLTDDLREMLSKITRMIYCDIYGVINNFEMLSNMRPSEREIFSNMQNQNRVYLDIVEQIYYAISNTESMPECSENDSNLPNNFCLALKKVYENLDSLVKKLLRLSRSVQIAEINKQVDLMIDTFNNQMNIINNYLIQCWFSKKIIS